MAKPFLRWAGGKQSLLPQLAPLLPKDPIDTYWEPFLGGGAMFFHLQENARANHYMLSDTNARLITAYLGVRDELHDLALALHGMKAWHSPEFYAEVRKRFNAGIDWAAPAFIYLNKTCFNGLWRENSKGEFNVPLDKNKKPDAILDIEGLEAASTALRDATLSNYDFEAIRPCSHDFVFLDPPYVPVNDASFTRYGAQDFGREANERLLQLCTRLDRAGIPFMQTNSDVPMVREAYKNFRIDTIRARRNINSKGAGRGPINEVVVRNY